MNFLTAAHLLDMVAPSIRDISPKMLIAALLAVIPAVLSAIVLLFKKH